MARCQCAGSSCSCQVVGGPGVTVSGVGSASNPYTISTAPDFYKLTGNFAGSSFRLGGFAQPVGNRTVFEVDFTPTGSYGILPDGSVDAPYPPVGGEIEVIVGGSSGDVTGISGATITWFGQPLPSGADKRGWYRFVFLGDRYAGTYLGASFVP